MTEDKMLGWHHQLNRHEFEQTLGDGEGQGGLVHLYIFLMLHLFELTNRKSISFIHKKHSKSFSINLVILMNFKSIIEALKLRYNSLLKCVSFDLSPLSSIIN